MLQCETGNDANFDHSEEPENMLFVLASQGVGVGVGG